MAWFSICQNTSWSVSISMSIQDSLEKIRPALQMRVSNSLARGAGVRENFQEQLRRFFDALTQAVLSGDATWLDPILQEWATARTQTDLEDGERNLSGLLQKIITYSKTRYVLHHAKCKNCWTKILNGIKNILLHIFIYFYLTILKTHARYRIYDGWVIFFQQ